jgi:hypothetical protein
LNASSRFQRPPRTLSHTLCQFRQGAYFVIDTKRELPDWQHHLFWKDNVVKIRNFLLTLAALSGTLTHAQEPAPQIGRTAGLHQALINACSSAFPVDADRYRSGLSRKMWGKRTESEFADVMDDLRRAESVVDKRAYDEAYKDTLSRFSSYETAEKRKACEQAGASPKERK